MGKRLQRFVAEGGSALNQEGTRLIFALEDVPFVATKNAKTDIHSLPRDDEKRMIFQALLLLMLRPIIPIKYRQPDSFLKAYPQFQSRSSTESEKLRMTANWMDLAFYTVSPRNNKTFLMNLIPRLCEGRTVRYVTGSGESQATSDRVAIFRKEGKFEKVTRPPRKKAKNESEISREMAAIAQMQAQVSKLS
jgi:hypothetical protein